MGWIEFFWPQQQLQAGPPAANDAKATDVVRAVERTKQVHAVPEHRAITKLIASLLLSLAPNTHDDFTRVREVEIYYGTMFGSAEHYARSLAHEVSTRRSMRVTIHDLDDFDAALFESDRLTPTRLFVFVVSTHFAGSPSPSAERFVSWISTMDGQRRETANVHDGSATDKTSSTVSAASNQTGRSRPDHPWLFHLHSRFSASTRGRQQPLRGMQYAVFGIGDSMYLTFNATGKFVDSKLKDLGASRLLPVGLGDCSNDVGSSYKAWETSVLHRLPRRMSISLVQDIRLVSTTAIRRLTRLSPLVTPAAVSIEVGVPRADTCGHTRHVSDRRQSLPSSPLSVRDNFGRSVELRFQCLNLREVGDTNGTHHRLPSVRSRSPSARSPTPNARWPTPSGRSSTPTGSFSSRPRTPRVALFDEMPFAEIVPIERVGPAPLETSYISTPFKQRTCGVFKVRLLNPDVTYSSVSTLALFPHNNPQHVEAVAAAFRYDLDAEIELYIDQSRYSNSAERQAEERELPFPTPCSIRTALTEFLELRTVTPEFIRVASGYVVSMGDKEVLESLASTESSIAYRTQIQDQHKGLLDLIAMAPTLLIPWNIFVNIAQPIKPRYFTIASSPRLSPRELDIAIAFGSPQDQQGLATSFLERILRSRSSTPVPIRGFISVSRFKFRDDGKAPMVLIACGVGFAPMRAIIQERLMLWAQNLGHGSGRTHSGSLVGAVPKQLLFLGTANEDSIVFLKDLRRWEQQMVVQVHHAYSDDRRYPRRYVQDIVSNRIDEIVQLVNDSPVTRVLVCGRLAMVRRIREIFEADQRHRGRKWFSSLHKSGRFIEEAYY